MKFDRNGKFIKTWGHLGSAPGEFDEPHDIFIGSCQRTLSWARRIAARPPRHCHPGRTPERLASSSCQTSVERENGRRLVNSGEFVVGGEWHEGDDDLRCRVPIRSEAVSQPIDIGQIAGVKIGIDGVGEFDLTSAINPGGPDTALRGAVCSLRHDAVAQQPRPRARERRDRPAALLQS